MTALKVRLSHRASTLGSAPIVVARAENAMGDGTSFDPNLHGRGALQHARALAAAAKRIHDPVSQEHAAEYSAIVVDLELRTA